MSTDSTTPTRPFSPLDIPWTEWPRDAPFKLRYRHLSMAAIGENYRVGVAIEELAPGAESSSLHYHTLEEEHVYILEGALSVRLGAETYAVKAGDYVCFPAGQQAGHCLVNDSGAICRYVIVGERNPNDVVIYTDKRTVKVMALGREAVFDLASTPKVLAEAVEAPVQPKPPISSHDVAWTERPHGKGFVDRNKHLTYAAVGEDYHVGVLIEGPPPGMRLAPKHYHMLEEEHALILEGQATLLFGDERYEMKAGDYVAFPAGQKIGHSFLNSGPDPCSYLMIGERNPNDVCVYPDSNKVGVNALRTERSIFDMSAVRNYLDGEQAG